MKKNRAVRRSLKYKRFKICTLLTTSIFFLSLFGIGEDYNSELDIPVLGAVLKKNEDINTKESNSSVDDEKLFEGINSDNLEVEHINDDYKVVKNNKIINQIREKEIIAQRNREIEAKNAAYEESIRRQIENLKLEKSEAERQKIIEKYANVFNLKDKPIINIIRSETNWFTDESLNKKTDKKFELRVLKKIRDIRLNPKSYSVDLDKISEYDYKKKETIREMVIYYAKLYGIDPKKALAIELHETGIYTSNVCKTRNNVGGMRTRNSSGRYYYYTYDNIERGIIEHMNCLLKYQGKSFDEMQGVYGMDSSWAKNVSKFYNTLSNNINAYKIYDETKANKKTKIKVKK